MCRSEAVHLAIWETPRHLTADMVSCKQLPTVTTRATCLNRVESSYSRAKLSLLESYFATPTPPQPSMQGEKGTWASLLHAAIDVAASDKQLKLTQRAGKRDAPTYVELLHVLVSSLENSTAEVRQMAPLAPSLLAALRTQTPGYVRTPPFTGSRPSEPPSVICLRVVPGKEVFAARTVDGFRNGRGDALDIQTP